jgi:two-component system sensor histidine kinase RpfC
MQVNGPATGARPVLARLRAFCRRLDREPEMALNRLVISALVLSYFLSYAWFDLSEAPDALLTITMIFGAYCATSIALLTHILLRPVRSARRRGLAMLADVAMLTYALQAGGEETTIFFPLYLWIAFGNGFRFGTTYLRAAAGLGLAGFALVCATSVYWQANPHLAFGLLLSLVVLPLYAGKLIRDLSQAKRTAEEASQAKSLFLASVSHELRTPLNAIVGMGELMRLTTLDPEQKDMVGTIRKSADILLSLIDDLLRFSRLEAGRTEVERTDFDLDTVLHDVRSVLSAQARAKGVRLGLHLTGDTPSHLRGDVRHLKEILLNLAGNAVKFTASGAVVIAVRPLDAAQGQARLRFEVRDTGPGIAPEAHERIFERFTQSDASILNRYGGTGLGLAIAKGLAEQMGGEIGVESALGQGSTFWVELPFETLEGPGGTAAMRLPPPVPAFVLCGIDRPRQALIDALARQGISALGARTAEEALGLLRELAARPDRRALLLMDSQGLDDPYALATMLHEQAGLRELTQILVAPAARTLRAGQGTTPFAVVLSTPVEDVFLQRALRTAHSDDLDPTDSAIPAATLDQKPLSILVAEDNRTNQRVIAKMLERNHHHVIVVENGDDALDALAAHAFDIVLMDVNMPQLDGIEATKLYRFATLNAPRVPIVGLTADATDETRRRCMDAGMDACLSKPVKPELLARTIAEVTSREAEHAGPVGSDRSITPIASHPKYRMSIPPALDASKLEELEALGGDGFMIAVARDFVKDGTEGLEALRAAVRSGDVQRFRDAAHGLRSACANVGATRLYDRLLSLRQIGAEELARDGAVLLASLKADFDQVHAALETVSNDRVNAAPGA